jgi:hypothetical protein
MALTSEQQTLLDAFRQVAGTKSAQEVGNLMPLASQALPEKLAETAKQVEALRSVGTAQADAVSRNTAAVSQNTVAQASGGSGVKAAAEGIGKVASGVLGGALSSIPLVSVFRGLFGGEGKPKELEPLTKYALPPSIRFETTTAYAPVGYGQEGLPRPVRPPAVAQTADRISETQDLERPAPQPPAAHPTAPQITVQVQALDSRSFMDRREDIARAVREAMLHMHSLNDVVNDL